VRMMAVNARSLSILARSTSEFHLNDTRGGAAKDQVRTFFQDHSKGATEALIVAALLVAAGTPPCKMTTFGSPRPAARRPAQSHRWGRLSPWEGSGDRPAALLPTPTAARQHLRPRLRRARRSFHGGDRAALGGPVARSREHHAPLRSGIGRDLASHRRRAEARRPSGSAPAKRSRSIRDEPRRLSRPPNRADPASARNIG
jgi:hypothetical protein